ncbi:nitrile hydratase accessory protein [Mycolicibacterium agri]|uniref:Nitrile hydratase accessory protein n=2 Tax=Mycolicibacterium agri TaxID=36811 RepID=A0A2A7N9U7_MYCAG|nr:nitrile hydratase accessory protein [Mycolicibacterium agri]PEG40221.1 nitrile hydratase accessory protein [Mycolicibacterium agri]
MTAVGLTGVAAPPRSNGELVFEEPWHSRAFAMAVALNEAGAFTWPQFQKALIARIAIWEAAEQAEQPEWHYYHHWLGALEDVLGAAGVVNGDDVGERADVLARRPAGHDHTH